MISKLMFLQIHLVLLTNTKSDDRNHLIILLKDRLILICNLLSQTDKNVVEIDSLINGYH